MHQKLNINLTIRLGFWIIQFTIQEMAIGLCTNQSAGEKSQESKQLNFAPQLYKFV